MTEPRIFTLRDTFVLIAGTLFLFLALEALLPAGMGKWRILLLEISVVIPLGGLMMVRKGAGLSMLRWRSVHGMTLLGAAMVGLGLTAVFDEVNRLFQMLVPMNAVLRTALLDLMRVQGATEWILMILAAVIVAGLAEETLFRGFVQSVFTSYGDVTKAVLVTAFLFAVMHFNPWWFIEVLTMGVLFGAMAWMTGSIFPGALAHGLYNGAAMLLINLGPFKGYEIGRHVSPWVVSAGILLAIGGFRLIRRFAEFNEIEDDRITFKEGSA